MEDGVEITVVPGSRLGPSEITGAIGAGGMGEVFRARDTKLNRDIAIESNTDYDVVSVDLATAVVTPVITTQRGGGAAAQPLSG